MPALAGGVIAALSVPPWGIWALAPIGLAIVARRLIAVPVRARIVVGLWFGIGLFAPTILWISEFHVVGYVLLVLLESAFFMLAAAACPPDSPTRTLIAFPAAFVLAEIIRGAVPFGGFPMGGIPLGQAAGPLAPAARIGGSMLVTALVAVLAVGLVQFRRRRYPLFLACVAAVALFAIAGRLAPAGDDGRAVRVAAVQGGGPRGFRAVQTDPGDVFNRHVIESDQLKPPLDLVLWPENAIDVDTLQGTAEEAALAGIATRLHAVVVASVTETADAQDHFQNTAVAWNPEGRITDTYTKVKRVPFGEWVPGRDLFSHVVDLSVLPRDALPGHGPGVLRTPIGRLGVAISYEVLFAERGRAAAAHGAEVLLVPTNAASFKRSQVPTEEVAASQLRAWETGRYVVQAAPTGYSAIVGPRGHVLARSTLSRAQILYATIHLRAGTTPYVRYGDAPTVVLAIIALLLVWRPRRGGPPDPGGSVVEPVGLGDAAEPVR